MIELIPRYKNKNNFRKEEVKEFSEFIFLGTGGERLMRNLDEQMHLGNFIAAYINMFMLSKPDLRFLLNCLHVATQADASTSRNQSVVSEKKERQVCSELVFMSVNPWASHRSQGICWNFTHGPAHKGFSILQRVATGGCWEPVLSAKWRTICFPRTLPRS